jgi:hypothetical protein
MQGACSTRESGYGACDRDSGLSPPDHDYFWPSFDFRLDGGWFTWWDLDHEQGFPYTGEWEYFPDEWPRTEWRKHRYDRRKAWKRAPRSGVGM